MAELVVVAGVAAVGAAYATAVRRAWRSAGRDRIVRVRQVRIFAAAETVLAVALLPPIATSAHESLSAHMVQHVLLAVVVAPLLVLGASLPTLLWSLPAGWREWLLVRWRRALRSHGRRWAIWVVGALLFQSLVMAIWHLPVLYGAAVHHEVLHVLEHTSYLVTATVFWWAVGVGSTRRHGAAVPVLFVAALPGTVLGAALTLSSRTWYVEYPSIADQQLAGVVMWGFAGLAYVVAAACLFGLWLAGLEGDTPGRPPEPAPVVTGKGAR
ncbi:MAG TPA: cytochrome c oxidase assembly protein [Acidimicrobiales bacterium]